MAHLSVVVTDDTPSAHELQTVVADWTQARLVNPSLWVTVSDITRTVNPPQIEATVVGLDGSNRADLFREIGLRRLDTVRLIVVQLALVEQPVNPGVPALGRELAALLNSTLPRQSEGGDGTGTRLRCSNVVIPASGVTGVPPAALIPGWDANVVVAPEDRPDLDRSSIFVRDGVNFAGHASAAIASVAGLWKGIDEGCLDSLEADSTTTDSDVAVLRSAVRAIVSDDALRDLADAACASIVEDPSGVAHVVEWARPALDAGSIVDSAFQEIVATGDWAAQAAPHRSVHRRGERGLRDALREAAVFNLQLFGLGLRSIVGMGRRAVESAATSVIVGAEGDYVVRLRPGSSSSLVRNASARLNAQANELRSRMLVDEATSIPTPNPATWGSLRRWCFGLVDGSALPGEYEVPEIAGKPQLVPPRVVVPDPTDTFMAMRGPVIRSCDAVAANEYRDELKKAAGPPLDHADAESTEAGEEDAQEPVSESVDESTVSDGTASEEETETSDSRRLAREELAALDEWLEARKETLAWRVVDRARHLVEQKAGEAKRAYGDATATVQPPADALRVAQRNLIVAWSVLGACFAGASLYIWRYLHEVGGLTTAEMWQAIGAAFVLALILGIFFNHLYYREVRHFEWMVEETLTRRRRTAEQYVVAQRESRRLRLLASRFSDWAEIIGCVLHRPWLPNTSSQEVLPVERLGALPAAVAVAVPALQADIRPVVMARAIQVLSPRGWATKHFDRAIAAYEASVRSARDGGHLAADLDTLQSPTSPLGLLWAFFMEGEAGRQAAVEARERIHEALNDGELEMPQRSVKRVGDYSDGVEVSDAEFLAAVAGGATPFVSDMWTPSGLMRERHLPEKSIAWLPRSTAVPGSTRLDRLAARGDVSMRVDLARRCDLTDVLVFLSAADGQAKAAKTARVGDFN